jgi:hypothetical protein
MRQVISELETIRRRSRTMLLTQRVSVIVAWVIGLTVCLVGLDFLLRLPSTPRLTLLVGGLAMFGYGLWTYLRPAVQFQPRLTELALRAERTFPAVAGRLASSVEFALSGLDKVNPLAARSVTETERRLSGESLSRVIDGDRTWRASGAMLGVLAIATLLVIINPAAAQTGLARLFVPFGSTQWPARTGVASLMHEVVPETHVHPRGQALALRAQVTKGEPNHVAARYRLRADRRFGPWHRIVLTHQGDGMHERLVDTTADEIELYFETSDARTKRELITLAAPPAVHRASLRITPPSYAAAWFSILEADLGPGLDERAITDTAALVGSDVTLEFQLNKPLPFPDSDAALRRTLGWDESDLPLCIVSENPDRWTLRWRLGQTRRLNLQLVDEYGLGNTEPIAYRIDAVEDRLPTATIMEPESDEPVLPTAVVPLRVETRDDVAVSVMGIEASVQRGGADPMSLDEEPEWDVSEIVNGVSGTLATELDLATLEPVEGDVVLVRGSAADVYNIDGVQHPVVRSPARRLRIISELDLARRFRRELGVVRQNAIRIETRQAELEDDVIIDGAQPGVERAEAQIAERIATQRQAIDTVAERMQMNRLDDEQLQSLLQQAGDLLDFAGRAANRAVEAIEQRQGEMRSSAKSGDSATSDNRGPATPEQRNEPQQRDAGAGDLPLPHAPNGANDRSDRDADLEALIGPEPAEADRGIVNAQREVREELADLIALLDRDEDTWVAMRRLEDLMQRQAELEAQSGTVGSRTLGRSWDELTAGEQDELRRLAERQDELAEESRQLIEDLRRRAQELEDVDPQGAESMRSAADSGEQRELSRDMANASERVGQNQMRSAQASQESAGQTLQKMLSEMRENSRANAQELLRRLASLIESIDRLITVQENEVAALERAMATSDYSGRDRAMIRLTQNTQSVAAEARAAGQESRRIARLLDRAADAQSAAVLGLRAAPPDQDEAQTAEERSLELLREARSLAEQLEESVERRELMRQRGEIITAYREFAEREVALRTETLELLAEVPLDRRGLINARRLGTMQEEIRVGLSDLRVTTPEILEAPVFSHVHARIDDWATQVTETLRGGELEESAAGRQQRIADSIGRLIEALEDLITPPDKFAGGQGAGQQSGGQGKQPPLIPPIAELMLLRGMQEQVYEVTQDIEGRTGIETGERRAQLEELGDDQRSLLRLGREMAEALQQDRPVPGPDLQGQEYNQP